MNKGMIKMKIDKIEIIVEILKNNYNEFDVELFDEYNNEIIFYNIDEFDVVELLDIIFDDLFKYEFVKIDDDNNEIIIKIDDDEFDVVDEINDIDELNKYIKENELIDELIDEFVVDDINDKYKYYNQFSNFYKYVIDENENDYYLLFDNIYKVFENKFDDDDIELFIDVDEFVNTIGSYYIKNNYDKYDVEINNKYFIVVDNKHEIIKNINDDELIDLSTNLISNSLKLYSYVNYDKIIKVFNVIKKYNNKIIVDVDDDEFYDIEIFYYDDEIVDENEFIENYDNTIEFIYIDNITTSSLIKGSNILYECIDEIFDDDIVNDTIEFLNSIYYYYYNELFELNKILDIRND